MNAPHSIPSDTHAPAQAEPDTRTSREEGLILAAVLAFVVLWAGATALWGLPGFYLPAVGLVPVVWVTLIAISRT